MAKTESIDVQMKELLDEYCEEVQELVEQTAEDVAKECMRKLRTSSPKGPQGYAKSWTTKKVGTGWIVYNKKHYQLTHLLENSHVIKNQYGEYGRTSPGHGQIIHIAPVEEYGVKEFQVRVVRGLS